VKDVSASPRVLRDGDGRQVVLLERATDFFHSQFNLLEDGAVKRLNLPERVSVYGLLDGLLMFKIEEDWDGQQAGSLMSVSTKALVRRPDDEVYVSNQARLVFRPGPRPVGGRGGGDQQPPAGLRL